MILKTLKHNPKLIMDLDSNNTINHDILSKILTKLTYKELVQYHKELTKSINQTIRQIL